MSFISLTAKLHKKTETKKLKYFPASYAGRFYSNLANNTDNEASSDFYGRIANDVNISFEDVQRFLLASNDFAKGMQDEKSSTNPCKYLIQKIPIYHVLTYTKRTCLQFVIITRSESDIFEKNILRYNI